MEFKIVSEHSRLGLVQVVLHVEIIQQVVLPFCCLAGHRLHARALRWKGEHSVESLLVVRYFLGFYWANQG